MTKWGDALRDKLKTLREMGCDEHIAAQAAKQIKAGDLLEAEETLSRLELYQLAWMRR